MPAPLSIIDRDLLSAVSGGLTPSSGFASSFRARSRPKEPASLTPPGGSGVDQRLAGLTSMLGNLGAAPPGAASAPAAPPVATDPTTAMLGQLMR
jgi:hypothetical protein